MHWYDCLLVLPLAGAGIYLWNKARAKGPACGSCSACAVACKKPDLPAE